MMHFDFLVIKGDCIKIPAIKDEFFSENITLQVLSKTRDFQIREGSLRLEIWKVSPVKYNILYYMYYCIVM